MKVLKSLARIIVLLAITLVLSGQALAVPIVLSDFSTQTVAGENFTFNFGAVPLADGVTDATFTIHARGDYDPGTPTEFLTWDIDSLGLGGMAGPTIGGVSIIQNNGINDVEWEQSFNVLAADILNITSDGLVSIFLDLNGDQTAGVGIGFQPNEFAEVTLAFNSADTPEPATVALLGLGLLALGIGQTRRTRL